MHRLARLRGAAFDRAYGDLLVDLNDLPELREMNTSRLTQPANDAFVTFMDAVREPAVS